VLKEFRDFAMRGNVVDLAIGVIIGAAFGNIVNSLVGDVIMPIIGLVTGGMDFTQMKYVLQQAAVDGAGKVTTPEVAIGYGKFIQFTFNFLIVAFAMFMIVKAMNNMKKKEAEAPPPPPPAQEVLLGEIRDLLARRG
jgi:large conductance mechanosensitive channel